MGQSGAQKEYNKTMKTNAAEQLALQREMFNRTKEATPEQSRYRVGAENWDKFIKGKNYSAPPSTSLLNFDLMTPARNQKLRENMQNVTGIGAAALGGTGDQSIALAQTREHNANIAAQEAGSSYENAVKQEDAYYKGTSLNWAGLDINKNLGLLGNATSSGQFFFDQQRQTLPPSFMQTFGPLIGAAVGAAGQALSGGFGAGGRWGGRT